MIRIFKAVAFSLVNIGALNWGLIGAFKFNLVEAIFGIGSLLSYTIYTLIGLGGIYLIATAAKSFFVCEDSVIENNILEKVIISPTIATKSTSQI